MTPHDPSAPPPAEDHHSPPALPPAPPQHLLPPPPSRTPAPEPAPRRKRWPLWLAIFCLAIGAAAYLFFRGQPGNKAAGSAAGGKAAGKSGRAGGGATPVSVATVKKGDIGEYINALGTVTPVYTVTVTSRVTGQLMEIYYHEGQIVQKGALLATIDPRPYQATVTQAQGQLERDQASLKNAQIDYDRYKAAFEQHAIPEQQLATQQALVNQDEGTVKLDQGNLDAAQINIAYTKIIAPITGRIGLRGVDPGNIVQANGAVGLSITQLQPITVIFSVAEDYLSDIVPQMRNGHKLPVDAFDRSAQTNIAQGSLLTIDNQIDTTTGTVRARATFTNKDLRLFPNEFVNARLQVKTLHGVNLIPTAAIQRNQDQAFVYVMTPGAPPSTGRPGAEQAPEPAAQQSAAKGKAKGRGGASGAGGAQRASGVVHSRDITIGVTNGETSAVTGVNPGEILITDGFDRLQEGAPVQIRPAINPAKPLPGSSTANSQKTGSNETAGQPNAAAAAPGNANPGESQGDAVTSQPSNGNQPARKTKRGRTNP